MTTKTRTASRYASQRPAKTPPHVALADLRAAIGLTLDQVCERVSETTGKPCSRGTISGIENGHRGASIEMLEALTLALGLRPGSLVTTYQPREPRTPAATP